MQFQNEPPFWYYSFYKLPNEEMSTKSSMVKSVTEASYFVFMVELNKELPDLRDSPHDFSLILLSMKDSLKSLCYYEPYGCINKAKLQRLGNLTSLVLFSKNLNKLS
jgi:hypothetical protein